MKTAAAMLMTLAGFTTVPVQAATLQHIDELAFKLERQTQDVNEELRRYFSATPYYRHLLSDVNQMAVLADHIHDVAHHGGDVRHLQHDVNELDELFHHVEEMIDQMQAYRTPYRGVQLGPIRIGHGYQGGYANVYAQRLPRLCKLVERVEQTLHHLQADLQALTPVYHDHHHRHISPAPVGYPTYRNNARRLYWNPSRRTGLGFSFLIR